MPQLIDLEAIETFKELSTDDPDFLKRIIQLYLSEMPARMSKLLEEFEKADAKGVSHASHAIVSASQNIGATALAELCSEIEKLGCAGTLENADELISQVATLFDDTKQYLDAIVRNHALT